MSGSTEWRSSDCDKERRLKIRHCLMCYYVSACTGRRDLAACKRQHACLVRDSIVATALSARFDCEACKLCASKLPKY